MMIYKKKAIGKDMSLIIKNSQIIDARRQLVHRQLQFNGARCIEGDSLEMLQSATT